MPGVLTNKIGPLPTWGWLAIATAGGVGWYLYEKHKESSSASTSGSTSSSNVPDYVFQNYNQTPPETSSPTTSSASNSGSTSISRNDRSPKVKSLEHKIYKTHEASEKKSGTKTSKATTAKKATTGTAKKTSTAPAKKSTAKKTATRAKAKK